MRSLNLAIVILICVYCTLWKQNCACTNAAIAALCEPDGYNLQFYKDFKDCRQFNSCKYTLDFI
ncbi:MAG: hypothetical protein V7L01_11220 [Nostoc sp.]|uniref:hypothetical protein n=1 Tax=Nostoc sp. TaxID=1180 RepID=UPI002FF5F41C